MPVDSVTDHTTLAASLAKAEADRLPIAPLSTTSPGFSLDDAYAVQGLNIGNRIAAGESAVGHKVGMTSLAMQQSLGIDQPDFGIITDRMVLINGSAFDVTELISPRIEAEFAFRIGKTLAPSPTLDELTEAIDGVAVSMEIIDSRIADWKITLVDTVADNASAARIVYGDFVAATSEVLGALPASVIVLSQDGAEKVSGPGSAVLGHPITALHWLATAIGSFGDHFTEGDVVLAGAVAVAIPLTAGSRWTATSEGLGSVTLETTQNQFGEGS